MSWKGFAKAVTRIPAHISKTTGGITETKDEEFLALEATFNNVDKACRNLADDAKALKDGLSMMMAHQDTIAQGFLHVYQPEEVFLLIGNEACCPKSYHHSYQVCSSHD